MIDNREEFRKEHDPSLADAVENRIELEEDDIEQIVELIGHRCQQRTRSRIRSVLKYDVRTIQLFSYTSRVMYITSIRKWTYCAGQDYSAEIPRIRKAIIG